MFSKGNWTGKTSLGISVKLDKRQKQSDIYVFVLWGVNRTEKEKTLFIFIFSSMSKLFTT